MRRARLERVINVDEMRRRAKRVLPKPVFDAIDGGAGDELTMRANRSAYERIGIRPRPLADVSVLDPSTTVLGTRVSFPVLLGPCSFGRIAQSEGELAAARAAAAAGVVYVCPGGSSYSLEDVGAAAAGPKWYQLYLPADRGAADELIGRAEGAGYDVLCVTIDTPVLPGSRERDVRNRLSIPLRPTPGLLLAGVLHPRWTKDFLLGERVTLDIGAASAMRAGVANFASMVVSLAPVTVDDIRWLRERWRGPLVVKGLMRGDECADLVELGVDGLVVSNHGGRNQEGVLPSIEVLPEVLDAVDGRIEVYVDGGIRRGWDAFKAIAFGARAVLIGRAYMYGLAVAGEAGVARVLEILRAEFERTMALSGCATIADVDASLVRADGLGRVRP